MKSIIAVIGGGSCSAEETGLAEDVGRRLADRGAVVICGGLGGVMEAVAKGARSNGGTTVGILPGSDPTAANPYIDVPLATGLGEMRNFLIVRSAHALIAIGGGIGTLSEIALAQRIGKPVVGLHDSFRNAVDIPRVTNAADAVTWALERAHSGVVLYEHEGRHEVRAGRGLDRRVGRLPHGVRHQANRSIFSHAHGARSESVRRSILLRPRHEGWRAGRARHGAKRDRHTNPAISHHGWNRELSRHFPWVASRHIHRLRRRRGRRTTAEGWRDSRDRCARQVRVALRSRTQGLNDAARPPVPLARVSRGPVGSDHGIRGWRPGTRRPPAERTPRDLCPIRRASPGRRVARGRHLPPRLLARVRRGLYEPESADFLSVVGALRGT